MTLENPIHKVVEDYRSRSDPSERLDTLLLAFELILRFDSLLLASLFIKREDCRDDRLSHLLLSRKFQLGDWYALLQTLVTVLPSQESTAMKSWFLHLDRKSGGSVFQGLLAIRTRRAHTENRTSKQFVQESLDDAEHLFDACLRNHPEWGTLSEDGKRRLVWEQSNAHVPCGPFILPGSLVGNPNSVLLYRGCSISKLTYGAITGEDYTSEETYHELVELLRKKTPVHEIIDATIAPGVLRDRMADHSRQTLLRLIELKRYRPDITVSRDEVEAIFHSFIDGSHVLFIVDAPAGAGKTTLLCRIVEQRLAAGLLTLLASADRLADPIFPDALSDLLRIRGDITSAFERVGGMSEGEHVLIAIDGLGVGAKQESAILSLIQWIERVSFNTKLRIIVTIRSDRLKIFLGTHEDILRQNMVRRYQIPPLRYHEAVNISDKLPIRDEHDNESVKMRRRDLINKLMSIPDTSSRRPGLLVAVIESVNKHQLPASFSAFALYDHLMNQTVERGDDGIPRHPIRGRILQKVADMMLMYRRTKLSLDEIGQLKADLMDPRTGERTEEYEYLLANNLLVELFENYELNVSFVDPRFFEFIAAANVIYKNFNETVENLCHLTKEFPPALSIAAFSIIRMTRSANLNLQNTRVWTTIEQLTDYQEQLFYEIGALDGQVFLSLFNNLLQHDLQAAESIARHLVSSEDSLLAEKALQLLVETMHDDPRRLDEMRFLRARALYDLDRYNDAEKELQLITDKVLLPAALNLRAEIAVSRGDYDHAKTLYETVLSQGAFLSTLEKGDALSGLGYALGSLGFHEEAEQKLKEAIEVLTTGGDSVTLAEAYGDLGELFTKGQRYREARHCFETNIQINKRIGFLTGTGVAEGLLGYLEMVEGNLAEAEVRLSRALEISRRVHNRWREAWVLDKLSKVAERLGNTEDAQRYFEESQQLFRELGVS
jgi:tetratricopeptide (TPR) repeat protein